MIKTGILSNGNCPKIYSCWRNMKQRCFNPKNPLWHRYGGRGIKICNDWLEFKNFMEWAYANGYKEGLSLDRIDNDGDYKPSNCQWITVGKNSQKNRRVKLNYQIAVEIRKRINERSSDLAKEYGVAINTISTIKHDKSWKESTENAKF